MLLYQACSFSIWTASIARVGSCTPRWAEDGLSSGSLAPIWFSSCAQLELSAWTALACSYWYMRCILHASNATASGDSSSAVVQCHCNTQSTPHR